MTKLSIDTVIKDLNDCNELLDKLESAFREGKLTTKTTHAILVKVNDYLSLVEQELNETN